MTPLAERVAASLIGLAIGDVVGSAVEGDPAAAARQYVEQELAGGLHRARPRPPLAPGQYTDDTILARELLASVVVGGVDLPAFGRRLADLHAAGAIPGIGPGTAAATERIRHGTSPLEAGTPAPYAGNGAAMRAGPLGVLFSRDPTRLVAVARDQAMVTHRDPRAVAGAVTIAAAAAIAARPGAFDLATAVSELTELVQPVDWEMANVLSLLGEWHRETMSIAAAFALEDLTEVAPREGQGLMPYVVATVWWALFAAFRNLDDFAGAIRSAIWIGVDTDTLAAMAGSIVGARVGLAGLPADLVHTLHDRGSQGADFLVGLSRDAAALVDR